MKFILCQLSFFLCIPVLASNFEFKLDPTAASLMTQSDFDSLVSPLASITRYQFMSPASATGLTGFDIGAGVNFLSPSNNQEDKSQIYLKDNYNSLISSPRFIAQKGITSSFDLGLNLGYIHESNIKLLGFGIQWSLFDPPAIPLSVAVRFGGVKAIVPGDDFSLHTLSTEGIISFPLFIIEPYLGVGYSISQIASKVTLNTTNEKKTFSSSSKAIYAIAALRAYLLPLIGTDLGIEISDKISVYRIKISVNF